MTTKGNAALVMWSGVDELLITPPVWQALGKVVTLVDDAPIDPMAVDPADLEAVEYLIGGWGAPSWMRPRSTGCPPSGCWPTAPAP